MIHGDQVRRALASRPSLQLPAFGRQEAAVLVVLVEEEGQLRVVLTRRSRKLPTHAGEVSFPGGRVEPGDPSSLEAALREAAEEVGLDQASAEHLGELDDTVTVTGYKIRPHVVLVKGPFVPSPQSDEVETVLVAPLDGFVDTGKKYSVFVEGRGLRQTFPLFMHEGHIIWGATARILSTLCAAVEGRQAGDTVEQFARATIPRLLDAKRVILTTHVHPDPDGLGCEIALEEMLLALGKQVVIANHDTVPDRFSFIAFRSPGVFGDDIVEEAARDADLLFVVDTAEEARIGKAARLLKPMSGKVIVTDHHLKGNMGAEQMLLESSCSSTAEIIYRYLTVMGFPLTSRAANALYAGIMFDTHGFRFVSNRSDPFRVAAHLVDLGADASTIQEQLFGSVSKAHALVLNTALARARWEFDGKWVWSDITREELGSFRGTSEDAGEVAPFFSTIEGVAVATFARQTANGEYKLAFRSKREYPIGHICQMLGGGGHANAGGATVYGTLEEIFEKVRLAVKAVVERPQA